MSRGITYDGSTEYKNEQGLFHREDGPAIEYTDGAKEWRQYGKLHRLPVDCQESSLSLIWALR